ncbi:bifunctional riboflavin kinase/FAD synthetase [Hydrogenobacter sp. T-2]|uniref:bifunctional riboflavin kinase/FAD synthetase n=1 Tax=Pampinifervens diazotrophicum TaxID=1632018 RepID=UPI002B257C90|nr:bifunctional riboflavin kinase/FAD synthetase [Hydrogenobacter sp. T-2]WPM32697.1 bifunctional riboflavin kinase/FAD synthetase [Hydrogenobacter sp. T-2]
MERVVCLRTSQSGSIKGLECVEELTEPYAVTVGNFDGIHRGHQHLLERLTSRAREKGLKSLVLSFYPHPLRVLSPTQAPCELTDIRERSELILKHDVDQVVFIRFDRRFSRLPAEDFIREVLWSRLKCRHLVVGYDWRFGYKREGEIELAKELGREIGFEVEETEPFRVNGHVVSSTLIRRLLHMGRLEEASLYLGRNYTLKRKVISGEGRGFTLGFPTANLQNTENLCLREGVYAVKVEDHFMGVANYGIRPTFGGKKRVLEVHILDFEGNLRDKEIRVEFLKFLREERKFSNPEELKRQIEEDISRVRGLF